jgi:opacity protein-like surface antigen
MKSCLTFLLLFQSGIGLALANEFADNERNTWKYEITPYLWAAGFDGTVGNGGTTSPINNDYQFFVMENLDAAGALAFEARKQQWSILFDALYVKFTDSFTNPFFTTKVITRDGFLEGALSYSLDDKYNIDLLAGFRYVDVNLDIRLDPGPDTRGNKDWVDPIVGLRATFHPLDKWTIRVRGDIGGFGLASDLATNAAITVGYSVTKHTTIKFGYRFMKIDFSDDLFVHDVSLNGVGLGIGYNF